MSILQLKSLSNMSMRRSSLARRAGKMFSINSLHFKSFVRVQRKERFANFNIRRMNQLPLRFNLRCQLFLVFRESINFLNNKAVWEKVIHNLVPWDFVAPPSQMYEMGFFTLRLCALSRNYAFLFSCTQGLKHENAIRKSSARPSVSAMQNQCRRIKSMQKNPPMQQGAIQNEVRNRSHLSRLAKIKLYRECMLNTLPERLARLDHVMDVIQIIA